MPIPSPRAIPLPNLTYLRRHPLERNARHPDDIPRHTRDRIHHAAIAAATPIKVRARAVSAGEANHARTRPVGLVPPAPDKCRDAARDERHRPPEEGAVAREPGTVVLRAAVGALPALARRVRDLPVRRAVIPLLGVAPAHFVRRGEWLEALDQDALAVNTLMVVFAKKIACSAMTKADE
jgi:hypothetical protein